MPALIQKISDVLSKDEIKLIKEINKYLTKRFGKKAYRLLLFGSKARGDYGHHSDTDIALILEGLNREILKEVYENVSELEVNSYTFISFIAFSKEEFDRLKNRERRIALDIEKEGIPL